MSPSIGYSCGCKFQECSGVIIAGECSLQAYGTCTIGGTCTYTCSSTYYNCDGDDTNGCETQTPCYIYGFQRYTFDISSYWSGIDNATFCWEGNYATTGGSASANLQWWNYSASAWVSSTAISTTEGTICLYFEGGSLTDLYNTTSGLVQFAARPSQTKDGYVNTVSADFAYVNVSYTTA